MLIGASAVFAAGMPQEQFTRPAGSEPYQGDRAALVAKGETIWDDKSLSKKAKLDEIGAEQMVQFCFLAAMGTENVLPWDSEELAALTAYTVDVVQKDYIAYKASK